MDGTQQVSLQVAGSFKAFLMKSSSKSNLNLYDHLSRLLMRVIEERPHDVVDVMEDLSHDVKLRLYLDTQNSLQDLQQTTAAEELAEQQKVLFVRHEDAPEHEFELESALPNVSEIAYFLEQAGVGLGREEMQRVFLALKQLVSSYTMQRCRLWGKILGIERSYIIAEAEFAEGEEEDEDGPEEVADDEAREIDAKEKAEREMDPLPQSTYKAPPVVPKEAKGTGANKFVYFVCNEAGLPWTKLPSVTPAQITVARQIRKFFTGRLDAPIVSYPPFPGNEANYLRAQIARISAGTQISPQGFYQAIEEEGAEEEGSSEDGIEENPEYEGVPVGELVDSLSSWVHHTQHILQQGRCTWVNLAVKTEDESNEEEGEEVEEDPDEPEPEVGPPLLTPLSQDAEIFETVPWSSSLSSTLTSQHAIAIMRSNCWPGSCAYAYAKKFENIYVGWGLKYPGDGYSPLLPPAPQSEYPSAPEITEDVDPTVEEEQALQDALDEKQAAEEAEEGDSDEEQDEEDD
ncbi:radial spoke head protein 6 homolog A isoform X1 [Syngnathus typhle]|uniref:radial spoke head protein 6 homolog A isoform X1 n=1 Tax=Syngnathus typhle TaxID=161592 RepID=UPI002A6B47B6|nr:radial spoke head protein 6 homolog A isoform X1 [Syngnathus typhle]XP_061154294.1 radial spoke head protein 6 homolog A isoform X1 [Syngnathus typhle]